MNYIPQKVKDLFIKLFEKFTNMSESQYKEEILELASEKDEKQDLEELFQSTSDYYHEQYKLELSGKTPSEYLQDLYLEVWKEQNPNATDEDICKSLEDFNEILSDGIINSVEMLIKDGLENRELDLLERKYKNSSSGDAEHAIEEFLIDKNLFGANQDEECIAQQSSSVQE